MFFTTTLPCLLGLVSLAALSRAGYVHSKRDMREATAVNDQRHQWTWDADKDLPWQPADDQCRGDR